jgi:hypothetical protein
VLDELFLGGKPAQVRGVFADPICVMVSCLSLCSQESGQTGIITTVAGSNWAFPSDVSVAVNVPLGNVSGVAVDSQGNIYVADSNNQRIFMVRPNGSIQIVAGNGTAGFSGDGGPATSASLYSPSGVAVDASGDPSSRTPGTTESGRYQPTAPLRPSRAAVTPASATAGRRRRRR